VAYAGLPWWSAELVERWRATAEWNNVRSAVRRVDPFGAYRALLACVSSRARVGGLVATWRRRFALRRVNARLNRDGSPSVVN
jgi:hypothetical protein